jgi:cysteine desulfurase
MLSDEIIYLDHAATTPVRSEVLDAMLPYWSTEYGNPSSVHRFGRKADHGLNSARETFSQLLNAKSEEIIFTGSGSESDNLAIRGAMWNARFSGLGNHLITCAIEHKAVLNTAMILRDYHGFDVTVLPVNEFGRVNLDDLEAAIRPETIMISIMAANNEIGTIQPMEEIGWLAREKGVLFHSDAVQVAALTRWNLEKMPVDLLSLAAHKFYGPKGIGILYAREGVKLASIVSGGGQEHDHRAGTENVPYAVGAAKAFELSMADLDKNLLHYQSLRDQLIEGVLTSIPNGCKLTGHPTLRLPNHTSFAFNEISGNELLIHLDMVNIAASSGSACLTGDPRPSSVLVALGLEEEWTRGGLRLTVGLQNHQKEIDEVLRVLPELVRRLRRLQFKYG